MNKVFLILCLVFLISGCSTEDNAKEVVDENSNVVVSDLLQFQDSYPDDQPVAIMSTDFGDIVIVLFPEVAPKAVENFSVHAENGYYDSLTFHRIIEGFMIQGGDPVGDGTGGTSIWNEGFEIEVGYELFHFRGALAMARTSLPKSQGSQFYLVQSDSKDLAYEYEENVEEKYQEVGGVSQLDGNYTVFGQTIEGYDVIDKIAGVKKKAEVDASGSQSVPESNVYINTIKMTTYKEYINSK
ncbi:MAG: peptidylprolyl isomerase [Anaerorhabdus sp.]